VSDPRGFERFLIAPTATLADAIRHIDASGGPVALVMSEGRLLGLVANGDIRRALVRGIGPERPVTDVMNPTPLVLRTRDLDNPARVSEAVMAVQDRKAHTALPVVDDEGRLHELVFTEELETLVSRSLRSSHRMRAGRPRVLLVGGAGYIGSVLARRLLRERFAVRVADRLLYGRKPVDALLADPYYEFHRCDLRHIEAMIDLVTDVDAVVYLAEIVGDPACALAPELTLETNFISVQAFATLCSHLHVNRFVYFSSCSVYGASAADDLLDETSALNPVSLYARMKIKSEEALGRLADESAAFSPTILRLATVFGLSPRPRFDLVVNRMTAHAVREGKVTVRGGSQWRPNVHVDDVARAVMAVVRAPLDAVRGRVLNVGDDGLNYRIGDLGELIAAEVPGARVEVVPEDGERRDYRVSFARIRSLLDYKAEHSIQDGVRELREFLETGAVDFRGPEFSNS
jgi:nucleoside-diphosphate-sugar epimerase